MAKSVKDQLGVDLPEPVNPVAVDAPEPEVDNSADTRPEWLPENFKSEEEFVSSYKTLQNDLRERGENQKRLESQLSQLTQVVEGLKVEETPPSPTTEYKEQLMAAYESDPIGTIAYLAQQAADQKVEARFKEVQERNDPYVRQQAEAQNQLLAMAVDRAMGDRYNDWHDYKDKVGEEIQADPTLIPEAAVASPELIARHLGRVYENIKAREVLSQVESGNFVTSQMKKQAQTISGNGVRQGQGSEADEHFARLQAAAKGMSYSAFRGS